MSLDKYLKKSPEERLNQFMSTLSITNRTPNYYVNWTKVERNTKEFELELHTLNYLLGKKNIVEEAKELFRQQPNLLRAIPSLIASRERNLDVLIIEEESISYSNLDFNNPNLIHLDEYIKFINEAGLFDFMQQYISRTLVDFVYGVETGLDSNARKNRSGTTMENVVNQYVKELVDEEGEYSILPQVSAASIESNWGVTIPVDKSARRFDEAIYKKSTNQLFLIETNYYGGGGSKLKAVAGEFSELNQFLTSEPSIKFIWITDGQGWKTARKPLFEAFGKIDYVFNIDMLQKGYLKELIVTQNL